MPPANNAGPPCPACLSHETERLPFGGDAAQVPVYSCVECGHVWRQPKPVIERSGRSEARNGGPH